MKYVCGFYREGKVQVTEKTRTGWRQKCVKVNERIEVKWKSELWLFVFDSMQFQSFVMASH